MTDRNRATTLRLRSSSPLATPSATAPRSFGTPVPRSGLEARRVQTQTFIPRRTDPASQAILDELAALGLVDADDND